MASIRGRITIFAVALVIAMLMMEFSGVSDELGIHARDVFSIIPAAIAGPMILFVGILWILNPDL